VDLGRSAVDQLAQGGVRADDVAAVFVTHMHSDHIADLFNFFWLNWGWKGGNVEGLSHQVDVFGPGRASALPGSAAESNLVCPDDAVPGLTQYFEHMIAGTAYDINVRIRDEGKQPLDDFFDVCELPGSVGAPLVDGPFVVMEDDRVRVTAVAVDHPPVVPSYAYRIDTDDGAVVVSGDTTICSAVGDLAAGASVLCHEAIDIESLERRGVSSSLLEHLVASHSDSTRVGGLADEAGVPTLVLHHLVPGDDALVSDAVWARKGQQGYGGQVVVGRDLAEVRIGR
jgi:ribonuclease BN (tRNA processing enzyme)